MFGRKEKIMKQQIAPVRSGFVLACALFTTVAYVGSPSRAFAQNANTSASAIPHPNAVVLRFVVQSQSTKSAALFPQPCAEDKNNNNSASETASKSDDLAIDPMILDAISNELEKRLSKKHMSVMIEPDPKSIPIGSFVVTGCIVKAHKGSSAGRIVGLGLGRSCLAAHVVLFLKTEAGVNSMDSFDLQVKGGSFLPPGPLTVPVNAATAKSQTLSGDGKKLADRIVKRLDTDSVFATVASAFTASPLSEPVLSF
jgi:hypothetical protein